MFYRGEKKKSIKTLTVEYVFRIRKTLNIFFFKFQVVLDSTRWTVIYILFIISDRSRKQR